uniref:Neur_chan_LBD domain-containing protein n=1 Tax=Panagrellus redivivus TaxID=6233 RepID=A0A7E4VRM0_PANRE
MSEIRLLVWVYYGNPDPATMDWTKFVAFMVLLAISTLASPIPPHSAIYDTKVIRYKVPLVPIINVIDNHKLDTLVAQEFRQILKNEDA